MSSQTIPTRMTPDEYLEWEATQEDRYEYIDGEIRAMSGATLDHNRIVMNIAGETRQCLQESPCEG
ncbi:MAG: Uma2 family endonuclease, partial [Armatimonadetes bacterium]|nr:Uma2 family endonuclease [Armatimonadota bacterium]